MDEKDYSCLTGTHRAEYTSLSKVCLVLTNSQSRVKHFAKGMALVVDPIGVQPQGVVTVLNNVIGNVLPQSQHETLHAIKKIIS